MDKHHKVTHRRSLEGEGCRGGKEGSAILQAEGRTQAKAWKPESPWHVLGMGWSCW